MNSEILCWSAASLVDFVGWSRSLLAAAKQNAITTAEVASWLAKAQLLAERDPAIARQDLAPDWDIPENLSLLLKYWAARLATLECLSTCLRKDLNRFANARPLIFERYQCRYTFDVRIARECFWNEHFSDIKGLPSAIALDIGSFEGLAAAWLMNHVLIHRASRLISLDTLPLDSSCGLLLRGNLAQVVAQDRVTFLRGPLLAQMRGLKGRRFHVIVIGPFISPLHLLRLVPIARELLVPGGILYFDYTPDHPVYSALSMTSPPLTVLSDKFLWAPHPRFTILRSGYHATITARA